MEEDYEYVKRMYQQGSEVTAAWTTVEEEVEFIRRNKLEYLGMTDDELREAAKLILDKINAIDLEIKNSIK